MGIAGHINEGLDSINDRIGTPVLGIVKREKKAKAPNEFRGIDCVFKGLVVVSIICANVQGKPINACGLSFGNIIAPITRLILRCDPNL